MWHSLDNLDSLTLAFLGPIGPTELIVAAIIGLLIFGKRLPEVGKSLGKGIVEFKRGLTGIEDDIDKAGGDKPKGQIDQQHTEAADTSRSSQAQETPTGTTDRGNQAHPSA